MMPQGGPGHLPAPRCPDVLPGSHQQFSSWHVAKHGSQDAPPHRPTASSVTLRRAPPGRSIARHVTGHLPTLWARCPELPRSQAEPCRPGMPAGAAPGLPAAAGVGQPALPAAWQHRDPERVRVPPQRAPRACPLGPACLLRLPPGGKGTPVTSRCPVEEAPKKASLLSGSQAVPATRPQKNSHESDLSMADVLYM